MTDRLIRTAVLVVAMLCSAADANPRLSPGEARKIALARVPGTLVHEKLKHKKQGHDHYLFKIKPRDASATTLKKDEVDAESGQIVKIKDTLPKPKSDD